MAILFNEYELLAQSGLFDPGYYRAANPDVAALNIDPLLHYLEQGAAQLRNPNKDFDAARYVETTARHGEKIDNPLLHFIRRRAAAEPAAAPVPVQVFVESLTVDDTGVLHVQGWAIALTPVTAVEILIDGTRLGAAEYGKRRDDVGELRADYPNARNSGFELYADIGDYGGGDHQVIVRATTSTGVSREALMPTRFPGVRRLSTDVVERREVDLFCDVLELTTGGRFVVSGWAVTLAANERMTVILDGEEIGSADIGLERPDVGNHFPRLSYARRSGFALRCSVPAVTPGEHLVVLRLLAGEQATDVPLPVVAVAGGGLEPPRAQTAPAQAGAGDCRLNIDLPQLVGGAVAAPIRSNLEIVGWALARRGGATLDILIDGERIKSATPGIRRRDVQQAFPDWENSLTSGFSVLLPHRTLPKGPHTVRVALRDATGTSVHSEFRIQVEDAPDTEGPWSLRQRMTQAEIDLLERPLRALASRPSFAVLLPLPLGAKTVAQARATLVSLGRQVYEDWRLNILTPTRATAALRRELLEGLEHLAPRVELLTSDRQAQGILAPDSPQSLLMILAPGDELGCDALLEFAVHAATDADAGLWYCDERRRNPASNKIEAFFKPQWSPDLLLSLNYLGRAWCARSEVFRRAVVQASELMNPDHYDLTLRLTEQAREVRHLPATLLQASETAENDVVARRALQKALTRRGIAAKAIRGRAPGSQRIRRKLATTGKVSIIIPTCAARGLIKTCLATLKANTSYPNFEIVCIENIPADKPDWKTWLRANADRVVETTEPFNWSRFNNLAVAASRGEFLLFLNDDIEITDPAWLTVLLEQAERPEVGVVGPQLLYPDRRVQHAGMFLAGPGVARHAFRYAAAEDPGYFGLALAQREVIAVTGACFMTRRDTFESLSGFDESHDVVNNDIDYCLRVWQNGLRTIYTPHTQLIHHELASRSEIADSYDASGFETRWRSIFAQGDPYFHPRLAIDRDDYSNEWEPTRLLCAGYPVFRGESIRRILIVKLDHIGDCVVALPAVRRLKQHFPNAKIHVLTGRASKPVWALEPAIDEVLEFDFFHAKSASGRLERTEQDWADLRTRLTPYRFDLAVDLRKHWETRSVLQFTGARYLAGFDMKGKFPWLDVAVEWSEDIALIPKRQHTTDDLVNLVDAVGAAGEPPQALVAGPPPALSKEALARLPSFGRVFQKRVVCVHPTAGNEMKQWPPEYFSVLIDQLIELEDVHVIIIGGPDDAEIADGILERVTNRDATWSMIGRVSLSDLPALIARCSLFVGNDSGPKHIAAALSLPTVGIHSGVVDASEWGPKGIAAVAIRRAITCAPCYLSTPADCGRDLACLRGLLPGDVVRLCQRLLGVSGSSAAGVSSKAPRLHPRSLAEQIDRSQS